MRARRLVPLVLSSALVLGLHGPAAQAMPRPAADHQPWIPKREKSVPGADAGSLPRLRDPAEAAAVRTTPPVSWPRPGTTAVAISSVTSTKARVAFLGRRGDALLLKVTRTDGVQQTGRVSLRVNYEGFRHAYGGDGP